MTDNSAFNIISNIKSFYNDDNNKTAKIALVAVTGSLIAYTAYIYTKNTETHIYNPIDDSTDESKNDTAPDIQEEKIDPQEIERKKKAKAVKKKKAKEIQKIKDWYITDSLLIVNGKGYNIKYFISYYTKTEKVKAHIDKFICASCKNICRDCVEIEIDSTYAKEDTKEDDNPIVMCEVCAKTENKKYKPYKTIRKMIMKETIFLPDPHEQDVIKEFMETYDFGDIEEMSKPGKKNIFNTKIYWGSLSKCINTKLTKLAEEQYITQLRNKEKQKYMLKNGEKRNLNWKFHDDANAHPPLFLISDNGLIAKTNKRSGTILFGPFITALKYGGNAKWLEDFEFAGKYFVIELKISEAEGCAVGFCQSTFTQFIGKNEGNVNCVMLNQTGWFYTSRIFQNVDGYQHMKQSPMAKWFKSDDVIVMIIDCTDGNNVKGTIYNKNKPENKFEIEKLPKNIGIGMNLIVGQNPSGTVQPAVTIVSATEEIKIK